MASDRFEYKVGYISSQTAPLGGKEKGYAAELNEALKREVDGGWEVVSVAPYTAQGGTTLGFVLFMRRPEFP